MNRGKYRTKWDNCSGIVSSVKRRLLNILVLLLGGIVVATAGNAVQSFRRGTWIQHVSDRWNVIAISASGSFAVGVERVDHSLPGTRFLGFDANWFVRRQPPRFVPGQGWYRWGFGIGADLEYGTPPSLSIPLLIVPAWLVIGLELTVMRSVWLLRRKTIRRWRQQQGLCASCGYDLRVTPDKCPECGTAAVSTPATA